jgi:hypothetical protein
MPNTSTLPDLDECNGQGEPNQDSRHDVCSKCVESDGSGTIEDNVKKNDTMSEAHSEVSCLSY